MCAAGLAAMPFAAGAEGAWRDLFDGKSLAGWHPIGKTGAAVPGGWRVEGGLLHKAKGVKGGDIVSDEAFENYELEWEWKIEAGGNNGLKYMVDEARRNAPGHEYQMLDDNAPLWSLIPAKDKTGAFYNVLEPAKDKPLKAPGEWNTSRLVVDGDRVQHWLNGAKVLEYRLGSPELQAALKESKFVKYPDFGKKIVGRLLLTDHGDAVWYRSIRIRPVGGGS